MRRTISSPITISVVLLASLGPAKEASAASGGPDAFGYSYVDQVDGAVYIYVDITTTGIVVGMGDDTLLPANNLGAPFELYGEVLLQMEASTNGWLASLAATSSDLTNECPMPAVAGGGGSRIAVLHDDLVTTVYYQYFDEAAAAAIGYPGETEGISVYQWVGDHYPAAAPSDVNAEAILFHDDFSILTMVAGDPETGSSSSLGIQDVAGAVGLTYTCNSAGGTSPGVTAVLYTLGEEPPPPPDNDCCTPSPIGTPGCADAGCEATVCAQDPFCCATSWDGICADEALALCGGLCGAPLCGNGAVDPGEDCDGGGQTAACDADCTFATCGDATVNAAAGEQCDDGGESVTCDDDCTPASCGDSTVNPTAGETCDDGGRSASCDANCTAASCGDGFLNVTAGEECDDGGASAICDADCTNAMCGDGVVNGAAGETCDDAGESAACDADCTAPSCGDGTVNGAAGEACDDGGESATCNADCTTASCGDGVVNAAAGEECDDSGDSKACDDDCTAASCGDGDVNGTAGEECDDGNTDDGDGCAADCTMEPEPGTTGSESSGGDDSTGGGETTGADTSSGGVDDTGGESGAESSGGPGPVTLSGADSSSGGGDTDTEGPGAEVPEEGCSCTTEPGTGRGGLWSMLGLLGLGALRRRRRA